MFQTLLSTQRKVPEMHLTTFPELFWCLANQVSQGGTMCLMFAPWLHRTPKISYSKKQEFSADYFDYLVSGVILRSLGRIEHGLCSDLGGKPGIPPLSKMKGGDYIYSGKYL